MRRGQHLRTPANPCPPNAPPVSDAEQSASSQPSPSRRKSCPAPAVSGTGHQKLAVPPPTHDKALRADNRNRKHDAMKDWFDLWRNPRR
jgi:hypothetical protein